jgi:hypothetical protein
MDPLFSIVKFILEKNSLKIKKTILELLNFFYNQN